MGNEYSDFLQKMVNMSYEELLGLANTALTRLAPFFAGLDKEGKGGAFVLPFICTALAADGSFTELEYRFLNDLLENEFTYDEFKEVIQEYYSDEWFDMVDSFVDTCSDDVKKDLVVLCLTFVSVDERISKEENAFIAKLLA